MVSFADAEAVFYDSLAIHQEDHYSEGEERFITIGMGSTNKLIVVIYTFRDDEIRVIYARHATRQEKREYESGI